MTAGLREDGFLNGRLRILQPTEGYRAGMDAVLLAAAAAPGERIMEAGCGAGVALLAAGLRFPSAALRGVEREPGMAALARANAEANGMAHRTVIVEADVLAPADGVFDSVLCNPPYAEAGEGSAPHPARRHAFVTEAPLGAWMAALSNRLSGGGVLTVIHRAQKLPALLAALDGRLGGVQVRPVHPRAGAPAHRVLVRAVKGSRAPFALCAGLALHEGDGFSPFAAAVFSGDAAIDW